MSNALTSKLGRVWVQPDGANYECYMLSCTDLGDISEPQGSIELVRCFDADGNWKVATSTKAPPDPVTTSLTGLLFPERNFLEGMKNCPFALYVLMRNGGKADIFGNYVRGMLLTPARLANQTYAGLVSREEDTASTHAVDVEAWPPVWKIDILDEQLLPDPATSVPAVPIWTNTDWRCQGDQGLAALDKGQLVMYAENPVGATTGKVRLSSDSGITFAATAADPFAVSLTITGLTSFWISRTVRRILAVKEGTGGAVQGQYAYSDDNGATWTVVSLGGAVLGHGPIFPAGVFALDWRHVFIAGIDGFIYRSDDGGATMTPVESGAITATDYTAIHFADETYGAACASAGIVSLSDDGGLSWYAATVPVNAQLNAICRIDKTRAWVATDTGRLWFTRDAGVTWTERTSWTGHGTGSISVMAWPTEFFGYFVHENAANDFFLFRTFNGGYDWESIGLSPLVSSMMGITYADYNKLYLAGGANADADPYLAAIIG